MNCIVECPQNLLVVAAAYFYYIEGINQEEVAKRLNTSRVMVARMWRGIGKCKSSQKRIYNHRVSKRKQK